MRERGAERDSRALGFPSLEKRGSPLPVPLSQTEIGLKMLYHDHPVLIKPYQIYVSEQESQEVGT